MKHATLKLGKILIIAASALMLSNTASAGSSYRYDVYVTSYSASGNIFDARYSNDTTQYIGCTLTVASNSTGDYISCSARDKSGKFFWCNRFGSSVANFKKALKTINDFSVISMYRNIDGTCSNLYIENSSFYL